MGVENACTAGLKRCRGRWANGKPRQTSLLPSGGADALDPAHTTLLHRAERRRTACGVARCDAQRRRRLGEPGLRELHDALDTVFVLTAPTIFVDADACPVKEEIYRVARRTGCPVQVVTNSFMRVPPDVTLTVVDAGPDAADDWIAERVQAGDIVVTKTFRWRAGR